MSFSVSFFARDIHSARAKLHEAHAPAAVKALVELALAGIPPHGVHVGTAPSPGNTSASQARDGASTGRPVPVAPKLCGILVETHGHIDEYGRSSGIGVFRVEPCYD